MTLLESLPSNLKTKRRVWRPISTAPKDGTQILCFDKNKMAMYAASYEVWLVSGYGKQKYKHYRWQIKHGQRELYYGDDYEPEYVEAEPTHWIPLPNPPAP